MCKVVPTSKVQGTRYEKVGTGRSFVDMCDQATAHAKGESRGHIMMCCLLGAAWLDVGLEFDDCTMLARKHLSAWSDFRRRPSSASCVEVSTVGSERQFLSM